MQKFPILAVVKEALRLPLSRPIDLLKGAVMLGVPFAVVAVFNTKLQAKSQAAMEAAKAHEQVSTAGLGMLMLVMFLGLLFLLWSAAYIFNHWVRVGAFGAENAAFRPLGRAWRAAAVTMLKLFLISLLLGLVLVVGWFALQMLGVVPNFADIMQMTKNNDVAGATRAALSVNIIFTVIMCLIYSNFSANLTATAIGANKEGLEHPHTMDFSIVLILLYALLLVPSILLGLAGLATVRMVVVYAIEFYVLFAVAAAHGVRYRICVSDMPEGQNTEQA